MFCFFPANFMSSTYTDTKNPFSRGTNKHSQVETFSQPYFNKISSNCLSHNSPAKGWPYRFRSRGTTGSSIRDHDISHLCRGGRILSCLSCATRQSADDIHDFGSCHLRCWISLFSEYCIRSWVVFYNITSEYNSTFLFLVLCLQFSIFSNDICPSMKRNEFFRPSSLLHRSPLSYFWLSSDSTPKFSPLFPFLVHCCLCCRNLYGLRGMGINLCTKL